MTAEVPAGQVARVVFDLGQVLAPAWDLGPLAASVGADPQAFASAYWAHRIPYDIGDDPRTYWTRVLADCGIDAPTSGPTGSQTSGDETLDRLADEDACRWVVLPDESEALLTEIAAAGTPMTLLSNAPVPLARVARASAWAARFDDLVFSAEVGLVKPDRAIYDLVRDRAAVPAGQLLFFDDRPANVEGAVDAGWQAHLWEGIDAGRAVLRSVGVLPA